MKMRDLISLLIYGVIFVAVITLFIQLLPFLIGITIVMMVIRYFKTNEKVEKNNTYYEEEKPYQTSGNIKQDVIDVEYTETIEK